MLLSAVFEVICLREESITANTGMLIQQLFYNLINSWSSPLFERIHSSRTLKPFTVSPLQGPFKSKDGRLHLSQGEQYWFRITSLSSELSSLLRESTVRLEGATVNIGGVRFYVESIHLTDKEHIWARTTNYEELLSHWLNRKTNLSSIARVNFLSPTYFRDGRVSVPLPVPELCIKNILSKWNTFSPQKLDNTEIGHLAERVILSHLKIESKILDFKGYKRVGFIGECEFRVNSEYDEKNLILFNLLWEYSFFSAVGASTTYGMGQVKVL